jgi:enoyl-CoA hydratase/carnithine racemase
MSDVRITVDGHVGVAEICRPPHNHFDRSLIAVLAAEGRNFCAGADFSAPAQDTASDREGGHLYKRMT